MTHAWIAPLLALVPCLPAGEDPRSGYDVLAYRLDLSVDPRARRIEGRAGIEAKVAGKELASFVLDLDPGLEVQSVELLEGALDGTRALGGAPLAFRRDGRALIASFAAPRKAGEKLSLCIGYGGTPPETDSFEGFHWKKSADGQPWIGVACQGKGASSWWPCKDSLAHPEDKPERTWINLRVPAGLKGVANGHLTGKVEQGAWDLFRWEHPYPCPTQAISVYVGAYTEVAHPLEIGGRKLDFFSWVLPEDVDKARLQFEEVPALLEAFSEAFGEYPFARSKFALVQSSYLGNAHASAIAYGSSFPAWCARTGASDPNSEANRFFDQVLVHETAREWWGNAVSARGPEDAWVEEGLATYAEAVYAEKVLGEERLQEFLESLHPLAGAPRARSAWVLHTLRWYVDDDERWWKTLRAFQAQYRYKSAGTQDFRAVLEQQTGRKWERFFTSWFAGQGYPQLSGSVRAEPGRILLEIENKASDATAFEVPIELDWRDGKDRRHERVMLVPGANRLEFPCKSKPAGLEAHGWEHVLGRHSIRVE